MNLNYEGFIPLLGGIYLLLAAFRIVTLNKKDPEKNELWLRKFGPLMKILCPLLIAFGLAKIFRIL